MSNSIKKVRLPKKIRVKDVAYKTQMRTSHWSAHHKALGMCHFDKKLIELADIQNDDELVDTYLHELLHSIIKEYELDVDGRSEEKLVTELANSLTDIFKNNKNLLLWIYKKLHGNT